MLINISKGMIAMAQMVSRETYKKVKRMNRAEMNDFLNEVYDRGADFGGVAYEDILEEIGKIPGMGQKRMKQIAEAIAPLYDFGDDSETENNE